MNANQFEELLASLGRGWAARDYDAIQNFDPDVFYSDPLRYTMRSAAEVLEFFQAEEAEEHCDFHDWVFDEDRQLGVAEYTYRGTNTYHGTVWIEIVAGKIVGWREYQHASAKSWEGFWNR